MDFGIYILCPPPPFIFEIFIPTYIRFIIPKICWFTRFLHHLYCFLSASFFSSFFSSRHTPIIYHLSILHNINSCIVFRLIWDCRGCFRNIIERRWFTSMQNTKGCKFLRPTTFAKCAETMREQESFLVKKVFYKGCPRALRDPVWINKNFKARNPVDLDLYMNVLLRSF